MKMKGKRGRQEKFPILHAKKRENRELPSVKIVVKNP